MPLHIRGRLVASVCCAVGLCWNCIASAAPQVGRAAPALVVQQLDGRELDLNARHGTVVVLNVWATWCPPCRAEMPVLDAFYRQHRDDGIDVIGLSADDPHDRKDVAKAMQAFSYPAAMASDAKTNGFGAPAVLPITYVIGADGVIAAIITPGKSEITKETLGRVVLPLLPAPVSAAQ